MEANAGPWIGKPMDRRQQLFRGEVFVARCTQWNIGGRKMDGWALLTWLPRPNGLNLPGGQAGGRAGRQSAVGWIAGSYKAWSVEISGDWADVERQEGTLMYIVMENLCGGETLSTDSGGGGAGRVAGWWRCPALLDRPTQPGAHKTVCMADIATVVNFSHSL